MEDAWWYGAITPNARIALVAATYADARDTMVEGESGLLNLLPDGLLQTWNRSLGELILKNDTRYKLFAAEVPDRLRGPQHHRAYADELAAWGYADTWDQMLFGLRLGHAPKVVIATTPKPVPLVRQLITDTKTVVTRGATSDNAGNLAPSALALLYAKYEGTRLGRQELNAEILDDVPGALWSRAIIESALVRSAPDMVRIVVAVDPSGTKGAEDGGDSIGIVAAGLGTDGIAYILDDATCKLSPAGWGAQAVGVYHHWKADRMVAERNFGGAMVEHVIRTTDPTVSYSEVVASRGKIARAEPVAALYEQGRVKHLGSFPDLEDQMCLLTGEGFLGEGSPDRVDAMVWAITELMLAPQSRRLAFA